MAPLVLPRDEKKWLEEEKLRKENEKAMAKLKLGPAAGAKSVKMDPYEEEEMAAASLAGTPTASASATPAPSAHTLEEAAPIEDAAVLGADDVKITVKRENISTYFNLSQEESAHEQFYVFQFPRLFPQFVEPGSVPDVKPSANDLLSSLIESKHKVKSAYHESEAEAWRDYIPGKWQGWGKNPGREGREILGATDAQAQGGNQPQAPEGRIGKIKVRRSGRTTLKLGGIEYDVSILLARKAETHADTFKMIADLARCSSKLFARSSSTRRRGSPRGRRKTWQGHVHHGTSIQEVCHNTRAGETSAARCGGACGACAADEGGG